MIAEQECGEFAIEMWNPDWKCGLTNGEESREVKLAVFVEFMDLFDVDSDIPEDEKYHYVVEACIVPHPDSLTEEGKAVILRDVVLQSGADQVYICDLHQHSAGVRVNANWCRSMSEDWHNIDYKEVDGEFRFSDWEDAQKFVDQVLKIRLNGIMEMIGFYLDQSINQIGSTGWDMIEAMVYGGNFTENAFSKMIKRNL